MRRRLFTFAAAMSLLLCAGTVVLWVRSYRIGEGWRSSPRPTETSLPYLDRNRPIGKSQRRTDWRAYRTIISAKGKLQFYEEDVPAVTVSKRHNGRFDANSVIFLRKYALYAIWSVFHLTPNCVKYKIRRMRNSNHHLTDSPIITEIPLACTNELAAVEFFEKQRWGGCPCCVHCGSTRVYMMTDRRTGQRNKRFLWKCNDCTKQYTVRIGAVYEESRLPMRHWAYAFWRAATSKKGVAALELKRQLQISYKSALFLMNRIRFAMAPDIESAPKLSGTVECDEVYIGGKPRPGTGPHKRGRGTKKTPVFVAVERDGQIRRRIVADVTGATLKGAIRELVDQKANLMTDENASYNGLSPEFASHETVCHGTGEYVRGDIHTNTAESSNALVKRGLMGIYHNVSREYLHRYLWQWDFCWNYRDLNDGERTVEAIKSAEGKRLMYKTPVS